MNVAKNVYKDMDQNSINRVLREYTKAGGGEQGIDVLMEHVEGALKGVDQPAKRISQIYRRFKYLSEGSYYYFVTNILSGFKTHATNTAVNAAVAANASGLAALRPLLCLDAANESDNSVWGVFVGQARTRAARGRLQLVGRACSLVLASGCAADRTNGSIHLVSDTGY